MKNLVLKIKNYFTKDIWAIDSDEISGTRLFIVRLVRIVLLAIKGFIRHDCLQKASGLTYYTLISIVPVMAMVFGIAKGFGFEKVLQQELQNQMAGQQDVVDYVMKFATGYLNSTKGGMLAGIGLVVLIWSLMKVLSSIEAAFNHVWDVKKPRIFSRKLSDYLSLVIIGLLFIVSSSSMIVFVRKEFGMTILGGYGSAIFGFGIPYVISWLVFTLILFILPNYRVKFSSALVGGFLTGSAFQLMQYYYIHFQVGMSSYNAIYGSFAAFPLFLVWLNTSWMIVLLGAEISYATQNIRNYEYEFDAKNINYHNKRLVYVVLVSTIIKNFVAEERALTVGEIAFKLKMPIDLIKDSLYELIDSGIISEVNLDKVSDPGFIPGIDVNKLTIGYVLKRIEEHGSHDMLYSSIENIGQIGMQLEQYVDASYQSSSNVLIKDMV